MKLDDYRRRRDPAAPAEEPAPDLLGTPVPLPDGIAFDPARGRFVDVPRGLTWLAPVDVPAPGEDVILPPDAAPGSAIHVILRDPVLKYPKPVEVRAGALGTLVALLDRDRPSAVFVLAGEGAWVEMGSGGPEFARSDHEHRIFPGAAARFEGDPPTLLGTEDRFLDADSDVREGGIYRVTAVGGEGEPWRAERTIDGVPVEVGDRIAIRGLSSPPSADREEPEGSIRLCGRCGGTGTIETTWPDPENDSDITDEVPCPYCGGSGA